MPFPFGATPLDDTTGALANANNNGPVFYVAGNSGGTANRSFTVNEGTPLLFAVLNRAWIQYSVPLENQLAADFYAGTVSLNATIDGVPVSNLASYAETSPVVDWGEAVPGSFGQAFLTPGFTGDPACPSFDANDLCPLMAVGYWLMVNLPAGQHVISTGGTEDEIIPTGQGDVYGLPGEYRWTTETTDIIDVVAPEPGAASLLVPWVVGISLFRLRVRRRTTSVSVITWPACQGRKVVPH
jgi:hypothetical protein